MNDITNHERLRFMTPGDPHSDFEGFPHIQQEILADEARIRQEIVETTVAAAERLQQIMEPTPLELSDRLSCQLGIRVLYKREDQTRVHSFKQRGAYNRMAQLDEEQRARGVIAASAGNHAQGVAMSAQELDMQATIVMSKTTASSKVEAVRSWGAHVVLHGDDFDEAYRHSLELQEESGATYIHPFDDPEVIAGQGVIALEILEQNPDVTHIFVPVGGGGLLAGIVNYVTTVRPDVTVVGVEPKASNAMCRSLAADERVVLDNVGIFADGVAVKQVGKRTYEAAKQADAVIAVSEDELCQALASFVQEKKSSLETAGALGIAGLLQYAQTHGMPKDSTAAVICSGANIDNSRLLHVLERAERASSHNALLKIELNERPGALLELCREVINGHNITQFMYRRNTQDVANISIGLSVVSEEDRHKIFSSLQKHQYAYADLSRNELVREHGFQTNGYLPDIDQEAFYALEFADRPGALLELLEALGDQWNISMFHYGGSAGDVGRVLIGFEQPNKEQLEQLLKAHTNSFEPADHAVSEMLG